MKLLALVCPSCGAPISVPDSANHLTCEYCEVLLTVERGGGVGGIVSLHEIGERTARMEETLRKIRLEQELQTLDRRWAKEREQYLVRDSLGARLPTGAAGVYGGFVAVVLGTSALAIGRTIELESLGNVGLLAVVLGIVGGVAAHRWGLRRRAAYGRALRRFQKRREELIAASDVESPGAV